ncbi:MAG: hypothetical protein IK061_01315, partial [Desulfovibrio sp.]|nr:hypothetical protein [Desulfovibrio sp.]
MLDALPQQAGLPVLACGQGGAFRALLELDAPVPAGRASLLSAARLPKCSSLRAPFPACASTAERQAVQGDDFESTLAVFTGRQAGHSKAAPGR